jgi:WD40 repeat protein
MRRIYLILGLLLSVALSAASAQDDAPPREAITPENAAGLIEIAALSGHDAPVNALAFSPDGALLASSADDISVRLWRIDASGAEAAGDFYPHASFIKGVAFYPQIFAPGEDLPARYLLATASWDRTVGLHLIDAAEGGFLLSDELRGYVSVIEPVTFSPDGALLAFGVGDGTAHLFDAHTLEESLTLSLDGLQLTAVVFSPDGALLAAAAGFPAVDAGIWRLQDDGDALQALPLGSVGDHAGSVTALAFSPAVSGDGAVILATAGDDGRLRLWEIASDQAGTDEDAAPVMIGEIALPGEWFTAAAFSPDGGLLAAATLEGMTGLWDMRNPTSPALLIRLDDPGSFVNALAFDPGGALLATGGGDAIIRLWSLPNG